MLRHTHTRTHTQKVETAAVGSVLWLHLICKLSQQTQSSTCRASGLSWPIQLFVLWQNFTGNLKQILFDLYQLISGKTILVLATLPPLQGGRGKFYVRNQLCTSPVLRDSRNLEQLTPALSMCSSVMYLPG